MHSESSLVENVVYIIDFENKLIYWDDIENGTNVGEFRVMRNDLQLDTYFKFSLVEDS